MTERERKKRRQEMERRMRARQAQRGQEPSSGSLLPFQAYITAILVGAFFLISVFHTETSENICQKAGEVIAYQIPAEEMGKWKERAAAFLREREISLPAFREKKERPKEEETTKIGTYEPDTEESP